MYTAPVILPSDEDDVSCNDDVQVLPLLDIRGTGVELLEELLAVELLESKDAVVVAEDDVATEIVGAADDEAKVVDVRVMLVVGAEVEVTLVLEVEGTAVVELLDDDVGDGVVLLEVEAAAVLLYRHPFVSTRPRPPSSSSPLHPFPCPHPSHLTCCWMTMSATASCYSRSRPLVSPLLMMLCAPYTSCCSPQPPLTNTCLPRMTCKPPNLSQIYIRQLRTPCMSPRLPPYTQHCTCSLWRCRFQALTTIAWGTLRTC